MKNILKSLLIVLPLAAALSLFAIPLINNFGAVGVENDLKAIALPEDTRFVESLSAVGKFVGNGNGVQFFGAMLIESGLSEAKLQAHYTANDAMMDVQKGNEISVVDRGDLAFGSELDPEKVYYIVYQFGSGMEPDLRGH